MERVIEPPDVIKIPLVRIDPPSIAMRETMTDTGLEGLAESLRKHGQLQNIGVIVAGDRYRIAYGHRRYVAARLAGLEELLARVFPEGTSDEEALKVDENEEQEAVNAAAQATYYLELLQTRCDGDVRRLCAMVKRSEAFLLSRLDLTQGDPDVFDALRQNLIPIGVAHELNRVDEPMYRRLYLHDAIEQGLSIKAIRVLRQNRNRDRHVTEAAARGELPRLEPSTEAPVVNMDACTLCGNAADQHEMTYVRAHKSCLNVWYRDQATKPSSGAAGS